MKRSLWQKIFYPHPLIMITFWTFAAIYWYWPEQTQHGKGWFGFACACIVTNLYRLDGWPEVSR